VFEKTCVTTQKNVKNHVFCIFKKNVKKRTYSFTGHLITPGFNTQLPEVSTGKKSPTSNILLRNAGNQNVPDGSEWITLGELGTELQ